MQREYLDLGCALATRDRRSRTPAAMFLSCTRNRAGRMGKGMNEAYLALTAREARRVVPQWAVAIFSSRESIELLGQTILALLPAVVTSTFVDVVVNGNPALALQAARLVGELRSAGDTLPRLRVWRVALHDKAHAWNQYVYGIWPGAERTFFVDGYVQVHPTAMRRLALTLDTDRHALAATGVPHRGRSAARLARQMEAGHGVHGNLYLLRGSVLNALRQRGFALPLGIYRSDALLGAVVKFGLDPTRHDWDPTRIHVVRGASWDHKPLSARKPADWLVQCRRLRRQGRGVFENLAARSHLALEHRSLEELPATASELIDHWMKHHPLEVWKALVHRPVAGLALSHLTRSRDWSNVRIPPKMMAERSLGGDK